MPEPREDRADDRGRAARRLGIKDWLQIAALLLACGAIVWRGGQMTEKLDTVQVSVGQVQVEVKAIGADVGNARLEVRELQVRTNAIDKELGNHETRITRIEGRRE